MAKKNKVTAKVVDKALSAFIGILNFDTNTEQDITLSLSELIGSHYPWKRWDWDIDGKKVGQIVESLLDSVGVLDFSIDIDRFSDPEYGDFFISIKTTLIQPKYTVTEC